MPSRTNGSGRPLRRIRPCHGLRPRLERRLDSAPAGLPFAENDEQPAGDDEAGAEEDLDLRDITPNEIRQAESPDERGVFEGGDQRGGRQAEPLEQQILPSGTDEAEG